MNHIFVETNWVVDCCAPAHNRISAASDLLRRARDREIELHLPAVCLAKARNPLHRKFQTRSEADRIRKQVTWALSEGRLTRDSSETVRQVIDGMENVVRDELRVLERTLRELAAAPGLDVIAYDDQIMARACEFGFSLPDIKPYDQAILACIVVYAERLLAGGNREMFFCELDSDLQPWDKNGNRLENLAILYDAANVWVCGAYLLQSPPAPDNRHNRAG